MIRYWQVKQKRGADLQPGDVWRWKAGSDRSWQEVGPHGIAEGEFADFILVEVQVPDQSEDRALWALQAWERALMPIRYTTEVAPPWGTHS